MVPFVPTIPTITVGERPVKNNFDSSSKWKSHIASCSWAPPWLNPEVWFTTRMLSHGIQTSQLCLSFFLIYLDRCFAVLLLILIMIVVTNPGLIFSGIFTVFRAIPSYLIYAASDLQQRTLIEVFGPPAFPLTGDASLQPPIVEFECQDSSGNTTSASTKTIIYTFNWLHVSAVSAATDLLTTTLISLLRRG